MSGVFSRIWSCLPPQSLRRRLVLILFATFCCGLVSSVVYFYWEAVGTQAGLRERSLQEQARQLLDRTAAQRGDAARLTSGVRDPAYRRPGTGYGYTFYDVLGRVRSVSASRAGTPLPLTQIPSMHEQFGPVFFVGPSQTAAMTTRSSNRGFVVVSRDNPDPRTLAGSLIEQDATPLLVVIPFVLLAFALIVIVMNRTLRPLQRASSEASAIGPASTVARVNSRGLPSEIFPLVVAFNGALDRLSQAYQAEKRLTADAAHELRTPLAVLRMRLERARLSGDGPLDWSAIQRDFRQIDRLIAQLLDLARKEQGGPVDRKPKVNLSRVAREASALMLPLVEDAGRSLTIEAADTVSIAHAAEDDLRDMLRNLIENALIHGKGTITVAVSQMPGHDRNRATVSVTVNDEGPGMAEVLRRTAFERFRKGDASMPGAGLGLAIVLQVAESHGGKVEFCDDAGFGVRIILPSSGDYRFQAGGRSTPVLPPHSDPRGLST